MGTYFPIIDLLIAEVRRRKFVYCIWQQNFNFLLNLNTWAISDIENAASRSLKSLLRGFLCSCLRQLKIPKVWRRALIVVIPKPKKPVEDPKSYRPISLLCVPYKILERLIYARIQPIVNPLLPGEQAGFRHGKSTVD